MKLKLKTMEAIFETATAKELDFLIYTLRFQDSVGIVRGIDYKDVCEAIQIHKSKFYSILYSLEQKGIIRVFWDNKRHGFWTYQLIDNVFACEEDYKKGYINLNTNFLWKESFLSLTKSEKVICLKILSVYRRKRQEIPLSIETLLRWTGRSRQSVKRYIKSLGNIFSTLSANKAGIILDCKNFTMEMHRGGSTASEADILNTHTVKYIAAANKIEPTEEEVADAVKLYGQFGRKYDRKVITAAVYESVKKLGKLVPEYINKMVQVIGKKGCIAEDFY